MFNLEDRAAYTWNDIFTVLSWGEFDRFVEDIEFPLGSDILVIRPYAREFVLNFYEIQTRVYVSETLSNEAHQLFDKVSRSLESAIGEEKTWLLCQWGNQLHVDRRIAYWLERIVGILAVVASETNQPSNTGFSTLSTTGRQFVQSLLRQYQEDSREVTNSLDGIDAATKDEWGRTLFHGYKNMDYDDADDNESVVSPTDILSTWIAFYKSRTFFRALKRSLGEIDYNALNELLTSHPDWIKAQARPSARYHPPLDLFDLAERV